MSCVDLFSLRIYGRALKTKTSEAVKKALESIWAQNGKCAAISTDGGSEFIGLKQYFQNKNVFFKVIVRF